MGTWPELSSIVVALISFALNRSRSGLITLSCAATINHDGLFFQAGLNTFSSPADAASGTCVAYISFLSTDDTSGTKFSLIAFTDRDANPSALILNSFSTPVVGIAAFTALAFCPSSGTSAATYSNPAPFG